MNTTTDSGLFFQTIPIFRNFAPRILNMAEIAERKSSLSTRLASDAFGAGENFVIAQGFILRTIFPLLGRDCPELSTEEPNIVGISQRHAEVMAIICNIELHDFKGAADHQIIHVAGEAQLTQSASDYVQLFGVPNFFFHMTMGYASLRANDVKLGKVNFDGLHEYSPGFAFSSRLGS